MTSTAVTVGYLPVGHDPSLAFVDDTGVLGVAEEERYSRIKRGRFITNPDWFFEVLDEYEIDPARVTHLAVPNIAALQERRQRDSLTPVPRYGQARVVSAIVNRVSAQLPNLEAVEHHRHHVCHAASAYLASPFDTAAVVTADGMGELEAATISLGAHGHLNRLDTTRLPDSLGYVYQTLSWWSGLTGAEREGKFMGLASWGRPTHVDVLRERFIDIDVGNGFRISDELRRIPTTASAWQEYTEKILGPRRGGDPDHPDPAAADVAASIQVIVERALLDYCDKARALTGAADLCLAGGVFMNTVANGTILRSGKFDNVFVQPLASDNGLALGAALLSQRRTTPNSVRWVMTTAALGSRVAHDEALTSEAEHMVADAARRILSGQVIGWVRGRAEVGARALGNRSVLADARDPATGDRINDKLKRRERWRPFAPMVLEEDAAAWGVPAPSPFMTFVHQVPDDIRARFPAVFHIDGTARLQTVPPDADPALRALLCRVRDEIGVGILLNTSLNGPGMPIVRTREHAIELLHSSALDCMVIGNDVFVRDSNPVVTNKCRCPYGDLGLLVQLTAPEPFSCIEQHAQQIVRVALIAADARSPLVGNVDIVVGSETKVTVMIPTWIDLLAECAPRLADWLYSLQNRIGVAVCIADSSGRVEQLSHILDTGRPGLGGNASEIEHFWLRGVSTWRT